MPEPTSHNGSLADADKLDMREPSNCASRSRHVTLPALAAGSHWLPTQRPRAKPDPIPPFSAPENVTSRLAHLSVDMPRSTSPPFPSLQTTHPFRQLLQFLVHPAEMANHLTHLSNIFPGHALLSLLFVLLPPPNGSRLISTSSSLATILARIPIFLRVKTDGSSATLWPRCSLVIPKANSLRRTLSRCSFRLFFLSFFFFFF